MGKHEHQRWSKTGKAQLRRLLVAHPQTPHHGSGPHTPRLPEGTQHLPDKVPMALRVKQLIPTLAVGPLGTRGASSESRAGMALLLRPPIPVC